MTEATGKVVQWYRGRNIFITGGTGFMGKVLVEKLLYSCEDIGNLYILMRPKRGRSVEQRIDDIWKLPVCIMSKNLKFHYELYSIAVLFKTSGR